MSITIEQRTARKKFIGSSDAAAIMGVDPFRSASDVWIEKTGRADGFEGNEATDRGNLLEPVILDWAQRRLPNFNRGVMRSEGYLAANFDGITGGPDEIMAGDALIVEAKSSNGHNADEWGEPETDQVPDRVIVQTHHAMYVAGESYRIAYVPVLMAVPFKGFEWRMYIVRRNDDLANAVARQGTEFWINHVLADVPPDDFRPSIEVLKRVRRQPNKTVPVDSELADRLVLARAACKRSDDEKAEAERALLAVLLDAEQGDCGNGRLVTYLPTTRKGYTVEETTYRTLRIKTNKEKP